MHRSPNIFLLLFTSSFLLFAAEVTAQPSVQLGFKAGGLRSTVMNDDQDISATERIESTPLRPSGKIGWMIGASAFIEKEEVIGNFYFQPELFFNKSSGEIKLVTDPGTTTATTQKIEEIYRRLDLPLMWGYRFLFLQFYLGPVVTYMLSAESELNDLPGYNREFKDVSVGYKIGLGLNDKRKYIDIFYQQIGNIDQPVDINGSEIDLSSRQLQLGITLGYFFELGKKEE